MNEEEGISTLSSQGFASPLALSHFSNSKAFSYVGIRCDIPNAGISLQRARLADHCADILRVKLHGRWRSNMEIGSGRNQCQVPVRATHHIQFR